MNSTTQKKIFTNNPSSKVGQLLNREMMTRTQPPPKNVIIFWRLRIKEIRTINHSVQMPTTEEKMWRAKERERKHNTGEVTFKNTDYDLTEFNRNVRTTSNSADVNPKLEKTAWKAMETMGAHGNGHPKPVMMDIFTKCHRWSTIAILHIGFDDEKLFHSQKSQGHVSQPFFQNRVKQKNIITYFKEYHRSHNSCNPYRNPNTSHYSRLIECWAAINTTER